MPSGQVINVLYVGLDRARDRGILRTCYWVCQNQHPVVIYSLIPRPSISACALVCRPLRGNLYRHPGYYSHIPVPPYSRRLGSRSASQMYPNQPILHDNGVNERSYRPDPARYTPSNNMEPANAQGHEDAANGDLLHRRLVRRYSSQDGIEAVWYLYLIVFADHHFEPQCLRGFHPSTAGSGPSGKRSKPSLGNISLPRSRQES